MKYPCNIILDLLPLYHDRVCSQESADAVNEHLNECKSCQAYYENLQTSYSLPMEHSIREEEMQKAASLKAIKKKLFCRRILTAVLSVVIVISLTFAALLYMKNTKILIEYQDNIQVFQKDGDIIARLSGNTYQQANSILVTLNKNGQTENIMYFKFFTTLWEDKIASDSKTFSEYVLAYKEKGAEEIDQIYYFTGDFNGLENLSAEELIKETIGSVQLWSK